MADAKTSLSQMGFAKTVLLPALCVFLIPLAGLLFFLHAQSRFDADGRDSILQQLQADAALDAEAKANATQFFTENKISELVKNPEFAKQLDATLVFHHATFRWMIRLAALSIVAGLAVLLVAGLCLLLSFRSHRAQYLSLSAGWQALRVYCAVQVLIQGILLVVMSFWVTALWAHLYSIKLIVIVAMLAATAVFSLIVAIFKRPKFDHALQGRVIEKGGDPQLWNALNAICAKVGTEPPDQVVAGIDDNFFVTEMPIVVEDRTYRGKSLYVSLSLLKQMNGAEADAVLAHEMAHFSGQDTVYSKKISPLLVRYGLYLDALGSGFNKPVFYFMYCFRVLYELSLTRLSRQREFRADRIAAEVTSPQDFASGLLRIVAYSHFRRNVQDDLFQQEQALQSANISERIETGFQNFATGFISSPEIGELESTHPFDTHPTVGSRLEAVGLPLGPERFQSLLAAPGDGRWYRNFANAEEFEREQWNRFEQGFRDLHELSLAYRYLPETDEEAAVVAKAFPETSIEGKKGTLYLNYEALQHSSWPAAAPFREITFCQVDENHRLQIRYGEAGQTVSVNMKDFGARQQEALDTVGRYYGRCLNAVAYRKEKAEKGTTEGAAPEDAT